MSSDPQKSGDILVDSASCLHLLSASMNKTVLILVGRRVGKAV